MIKSRRMTWAGYVAYMKKRNAHKVLVGKPEVKRVLRRPRCKWDNNIKIHFRKMECYSKEWIHLAQDRDQWSALVNKVINLRIP
jgi:hypothetical protein